MKFTNSQRMEFFVIAMILTFASSGGTQLDGPQNTLSAVGSTVTLRCLSPSRNCSGIDWQKYIPGASPVTIFKGPRTILNTNVSSRDRYSVDNSSGCDLVIRNVQLTDAGRFICSAIMNSSQITKTAYLIIIETQPKCTLNGSLNGTVEGDGMHLTCEITFNGTNRASLDWKGVEDAPAAVKNGNTINRSYSIVASAPDVPSFTCEASFAYETIDNTGRLIDDLAKNSIRIIACSTSAIKTLYSVRDVTLSPSYSRYPPGTGITCAAKGHPSPTFKWQENEDNGVWMDIQNQNSNKFAMSNVSSKKYRCIAMNVVRSRSYNATSKVFQVNKTGTLTTVEVTMFYSTFGPVHAKDDLSTTTISTSENRLGFHTGVGIGIGIGVGIGFIAAILLASIAFAMLVRHKYLELHSSPGAGGVVRHQDHEMSSAVDRFTPRTGAPLVGEQESAYASLGEDRDANEYASLEQRQKAKPKKKSKP